MYNPNDDPDVTSGLQDDAKKEMTTPGTSDGDHGFSAKTAQQRVVLQKPMMEVVKVLGTAEIVMPVQSASVEEASRSA